MKLEVQLGVQRGALAAEAGRAMGALERQLEEAEGAVGKLSGAALSGRTSESGESRTTMKAERIGPPAVCPRATCGFAPRLECVPKAERIEIFSG